MHTPTTTETTNAGRFGHRKINGKRGIELNKDQITLRLLPQLMEELQTEAYERGISLNAYITLIILARFR